MLKKSVSGSMRFIAPITLIVVGLLCKPVAAAQVTCQTSQLKNWPELTQPTLNQLIAGIDDKMSDHQQLMQLLKNFKNTAGQLNFFYSPGGGVCTFSGPPEASNCGEISEKYVDIAVNCLKIKGAKVKGYSPQYGFRASIRDHVAIGKGQQGNAYVNDQLMYWIFKDHYYVTNVDQSYDPTFTLNWKGTGDYIPNTEDAVNFVEPPGKIMYIYFLDPPYIEFSGQRREYIYEGITVTAYEWTYIPSSKKMPKTKENDIYK